MDRTLNRTSRKLLWPILIILSAVFAGLLALNNSGSFLQRAILFWFILICPGMAFIGLMDLQDGLTQFVMSIALSLVISILVAELMLLTHLWSPLAILFILIAISLVGAIVQISRVYIKSTRRNV